MFSKMPLRRPYIILIVLIVLLALWALFRPELLFVKKHVDEPLPTTMRQIHNEGRDFTV